MILIFRGMAGTARSRKTLGVLMPGESSIVAVVFPVEFCPFLWVISYLVHGLGIVQPSVDHGVKYAFRISDILQRILLQDQQVGQFSNLQGTDLFAHANILRSVDSRSLQGFVIGHTTHLQQPEFPVSSKALDLPVGSHVYLHSKVCKFFGGLRDQDGSILVFLLRNHGAVTGTGVYNGSWSEFQQSLVLPDIRLFIPVIFSVDHAIIHNEGRSIAYVAVAPKGLNIFVDRSHGNIVFYSGMPVHDHAHVVEEGTSPFRHHIHFEFPGSLKDLLPLLPAGLVVAFYRSCTKGLCSS